MASWSASQHAHMCARDGFLKRYNLAKNWRHKKEFSLFRVPRTFTYTCELHISYMQIKKQKNYKKKDIIVRGTII